MIALLIFWGAIAAHIPPACSVDIGSKIIIPPSIPIVNGPQSLELRDKSIALIFWSFKCPVALAYDGRINELQDKYGSRGVAVFGVTSAANETAAEIRANTANLNLKVPVMLDLDGSLAEILGATHTPSVFILDRNGILRYKGSLDNNKKAGENGRIAYAEDAMDAILAARAVAIPETRPFGCSIKRRGVKE